MPGSISGESTERLSITAGAWWLVKRGLAWALATILGLVVLAAVIAATWTACLYPARAVLAAPTPSSPQVTWRPHSAGSSESFAAVLPGCSEVTVLRWDEPGSGRWTAAVMDCGNNEYASSYAASLSDQSDLAASVGRQVSADVVGCVSPWASGAWVGLLWTGCDQASLERVGAIYMALKAEAPQRPAQAGPGVDSGTITMLVALAFLARYVVLRRSREPLVSPKDVAGYHDMTGKLGRVAGGWAGFFSRWLYRFVIAFPLFALVQAFLTPTVLFKVVYVILAVFLGFFAVFAVQFLPSGTARGLSQASSERMLFILGRTTLAVGSFLPIAAVMAIPFANHSLPLPARAQLVRDFWVGGVAMMTQFPLTPLSFLDAYQPWLLWGYVAAVAAAFWALRSLGYRWSRPLGTEVAVGVAKVLFLRSFADDSVPIRSNFFATSLGELLSARRKVPFLAFLSDLISHFGQMVVVDPPHGKAVQSGAGLSYSGDAWKAGVIEQASQSLFTVLSVNSSAINPGFSWELELVGGVLPHDRVLLVIGPLPRDGFAERWQNFRSSVKGLPRFAGLPEEIPDGVHVLVAGDDGSWDAYGARWRSDQTYVTCISEAVRQHWTTWAQQAGMPSDRAAAALARFEGAGAVQVFMRRHFNRP
jgi:hypothetical protein